MGADLGVPLSDLRLLCVSVAGGVSRKTFTQFSKREKQDMGTEPGGAPLRPKAPLWVDRWLGGRVVKRSPKILHVKT